MGQITTGVGLVSGINTAELIDQLLAIEARPQQLVQQRNTVLTTQQVAFQDINAKLLVLNLSAGAFATNNIFNSTSATSSNESVLTVSSGTSAVAGTYDFTVSRLVTTQQTITSGFVDQDTTPVAPSGGTLTFEFGDARLDSDTQLSQLNGGNGVNRGKIQIVDRAGNAQVIDLSKALTVNDVLDEINNAASISVTASINGDALELVDISGGGGTLAVGDIGLNGTTASLGLDVAAVGNTLTGSQVNNVGLETSLNLLNDRNGVRIQQSVDDFQITRRDGTTFNVNLDATVADLGDVINAINTASGGDVTASINTAGTGLQLIDTSTDNGSTFQVTALNSSNAAADLGILQSDGDADATIVGTRVLAGLNSKLIGNLRGGLGTTTGTIDITNRLGGGPTSIDLSSAESIGDIVTLINNASAGVTASLNNAGNGILLTDTTGGSSNLIVADNTGTLAADLGLAGSVAQDTIDSGNLQLRYISEATRLEALNGGRGVASGQFTITDSSGAAATVDLTQGNEVTIQDVISEINTRGLQINASVNANGDGILIQDTGPGTIAITISEDGSTTARDLGLLGTAANPGDDFNGSFEKTVTLDATDTLDDVAQKINNEGFNVTATVINDGSSSRPFRLSLLADVAGKAGAFVFDDNQLGFGATRLVEAQDAAVFFGSADPAKAISITSTTNTLNTVVPGVTIDLVSTSDSPVQVAISRDDGAIVDAGRKFVDDFNVLVDTINDLDSFNPDTEERGLLLGDSTIAQIRSSLFRLVNSRNTDLSSQFVTLAQVGITVRGGSRLSFDETKFRDALASDFDAVEQLFTFKETETDEDTGEVTLTAGGILPRIEDLLDNLTDPLTGTLQSRITGLDDLIALGNERIDQLQIQLDAKRARLEFQFLSMERALAQLQTQSTALAQFQSSFTAATSTGNNN